MFLSQLRYKLVSACKHQTPVLLLHRWELLFCNFHVQSWGIMCEYVYVSVHVCDYACWDAKQKTVLK